MLLLSNSYIHGWLLYEVLNNTSPSLALHHFKKGNSIKLCYHTIIKITLTLRMLLSNHKQFYTNTIISIAGIVTGGRKGRLGGAPPVFTVTP